MSIAAMMHVWLNSQATANDRLILLAIADEADDQGRNAFPSTRRLADKANCHRQTVMECLKRLEASGELEIIRPETLGRGRFNRYKLPMGMVTKSDHSSDTEAPFRSDSGSFPVGPIRPNPGKPDPKESLFFLSEHESSSTQGEKQTDETITDVFEVLWKIYPRHVEKAAAFKAFKATLKRVGDPSELETATANYARHCQGLPDSKFIKHPKTFFGPTEPWRDWVAVEDDPLIDENGDRMTEDQAIAKGLNRHDPHTLKWAGY